MGKLFRRLEIAAAWSLLEFCYWFECYLWERYDQQFVTRYIMPELACGDPPEPTDINTDPSDDIPF
jgi:hypothetical protein